MLRARTALSQPQDLKDTFAHDNHQSSVILATTEDPALGLNPKLLATLNNVSFTMASFLSIMSKN